MENSMLNIEQLCQYVNVSKSLIRKLIRKNSIPYYRIGAKLLFQKQEIDNWLKSHKNSYEEL